MKTEQNNQALVKLDQEQLPSIAEAMEIAPILVESGMFPGITSKPQAVAKILYGRELGIGPITSLQLVDVVKGRLRLRSQLIALLVKRSKRYDYTVEELTEERAVIVFYDKGKPVYSSKFTIEEAKNAGLVRPDSAWKTYPRDMLFARAMSHGALKVCPEVIGPYEPLEVQGGYDVVDGVPVPEGEPPQATWGTFWGKVAELGLTEDEVHAKLGGASVKDWLAQGHSLDEALLQLIKVAGDKATADLFGNPPASPPSTGGATPPSNQAPTMAAGPASGGAVRQPGPSPVASTPAAVGTDAVERGGHPAAAERKFSRPPEAVKSYSELLRACNIDFHMQPKDVYAELNVANQSELTETPQQCYIRIAAVHAGPKEQGE